LLADQCDYQHAPAWRSVAATLFFGDPELVSHAIKNGEDHQTNPVPQWSDSRKLPETGLEEIKGGVSLLKWPPN
jgi:hypothetical protein